MSKTVFVVSQWDQYDGYLEPEAAFASYADAEAYIATKPKRHIGSGYDITELDVHATSAAPLPQEAGE